MAAIEAAKSAENAAENESSAATQAARKKAAAISRQKAAEQEEMDALMMSELEAIEAQARRPPGASKALETAREKVTKADLRQLEADY